ncbi:hypothetical protein PVK06_018276 [Gossypium arboreum]|uniref:Uncharacterized protein n=1 Tax=Gossypium arboreum TaxID=29729 RepID=A0ABR0Q6A2_GOSAR|nr:hypothetical protein PVK06_018276 [Gossypium arboreum]
MMNRHDEPGTIVFRLGGLVRHMSVLEFGASFGLYTEEFMTFENFVQLHRHIHYSPSCCWSDLTASTVPYDASRSKATSLPPTLHYIHAILAHTLTERRESTGVVNTTDAYFLWSMATGHDEPDDITDDVPPPHEDPPPLPPPCHQPLAATLTDLSERFTRFE